MSRKVYVDVFAEFNTEGQIRPKYFIWEDGKRYNVDKILNICRAASLKVGGLGIRYTCLVYGKQTQLFLETENRWFIEAKI